MSVIYMIQIVYHNTGIYGKCKCGKNTKFYKKILKKQKNGPNGTVCDRKQRALKCPDIHFTKEVALFTPP